MADGLVTVAEACRLLGMSERTLRRSLREPELQAKLQAINRQVGGRNRQVSLIDPALFALLEQRFSSPQGVHHRVSEATGIQQASTGATPQGIAVAYEVALRGKDEVIVAKDAQIAILVTALEHEREQSRIHGETASRAQMLLSISNPVHQPESFWRKWFSKRAKT